MTEWDVVGVLVVLVGLLISIINPIIKLTKSITELTTSVKRLNEDMVRQDELNVEGHRRIWDELGVQDEKLSDHETRIAVLENHEKA